MRYLRQMSAGRGRWGGELLRLYCYCSCVGTHVCERNGQVSPEQLSLFFLVFFVLFFFFLTPTTLASISGPLPNLTLQLLSYGHLHSALFITQMHRRSSTQRGYKVGARCSLCCHVFGVGTSPTPPPLLLPVFSYGRSTLSAIPLDSGSLYCLTSFSPSSLSLGPWQLLSQCFAPRDSGRGGWVGKREREREGEMEWGERMEAGE